GPGRGAARAAEGGWPPKDVQAHLNAWKGRTVDRLRALRVGASEPIEVETDEAEDQVHAERVAWSWPEVVADAEASTDELVVEIEAAPDETLALPRISGTIMGNGSEHTLTHLTPIPAEAALQRRAHTP